MRKLISLSLGLALASTAFVALPASAEPAVVLRDQGPCAMPGVNAVGGVDFGLYSVGELTQLVQEDDHVVMTCKSKDVQLINLSRRTQHYYGFDCYPLTANGDMVLGVGMATIGKHGRGSMKCEATIPAEETP